jgi:hypothetical protein
VTRNLVGAYALTLKNPWADLIARSDKRVENRTWMPHQGVHQLLIHAGKGWDDNAPAFSVGATSAILAVADLAFACNTSRHTGAVVCGCGKWAAAGQCHWNLTNVIALPEPVPATGRQGLWRPDRATLDAVQAQLAAVAA